MRQRHSDGTGPEQVVAVGKKPYCPIRHEQVALSERHIAGSASDHLVWDEGTVKGRLEEAAETLRAMALSGRDRPTRLGARWPDVVRQSCEAYGYGEVQVRPPAPAPASISRADEAVTWLLWLSDAERKISWARASGVTWRRLEDIDGRSHVTLRKIQSSALECICRHLNAKPGGMQPERP